jgi:DtxR family Mn-dependent transcriptional regulator
MRKHRLAECLLIDVIKMPWEEVHIEACRWEHVISESVERRVLELLDYPVLCPHGNVIPGLLELDLPARVQQRVLAVTSDAVATMTEVAGEYGSTGIRVIVRRISEQIQSDLDLMLKLRRAGIQPGREVMLMAGEHGVRVTAADSMDTSPAEFSGLIASHVFVSPVPATERAHDGLG